jgi:hypothetical protein
LGTVLSFESIGLTLEATMGTGLAWANATLAFLLELAALDVLAWGGWRLGGDGVLRVLPAVALPALAAVLWGVFAAPQADPSTAGRLAVQVVVLGGAALVLGWAASPQWAAGWVAVVAANLVLATLLPAVGTAPVG